MEKGQLIVISAPSGAGKTTLVRAVMGRFKNLRYSVSHTTRPPRTGESHGKDYFFVDEKAFQALIDQGQMLEWAKVHGNYYGTSRAFVMDHLDAGQNILLDIDVQGAKQVMASGLPMTSIFIMPPSVEVLAQRLKSRGTDSDEVIQKRLDNAAGEMAQRDAYAHVVVNDRLDDAVAELSDLFAQVLG